MEREKMLAIRIVAIVVFLTAGVLLVSVYVLSKNPFLNNASSPVPRSSNLTASNLKKEKQPNEDLIRVSFPSAGEKIGGTIHITGIARGTWYFEGDFPVELVDASGKILASAPASAQGEWMKEGFVPFSATLKYPVSKITPAKLILKKDNPSDMRELDASIEIPIVLEPEKTISKVFFSSRYSDSNTSYCEQVFPTARIVSESMAYARQALEELLKGPNKQEKDLGYSTAIPPNVKIKQFDATMPTAEVDLSRELLQMDVDVACRRILIQKQIEETIKKTSGATSVKITVDGQDFPGQFPDEGPKMK